MAQTKYVKPMEGFAAIVNLILGTGPILVPYSFVNAGYVFSSIWILIVTFISF